VVGALTFLMSPHCKWRGILLFLPFASSWSSCPRGAFHFSGVQQFGAVATAGQNSNTLGKSLRLLNAGRLGSQGRQIAKTTREGRTYFGVVGCSTRMSRQEELLSLNLLDHSISFDIDVSRVGCNCNAALYLVSMAQNSDSLSSDKYCRSDAFYCDANRVSHAFFSFLGIPILSSY
jgi:hypothetical protein